jgi:hypothetical protein
MSVAQITNELLAVQSSIVRDKVGGGLFRIPSRMTEAAKAIYRAFGIARNTTPSSVTEHARR